MNWYVNCTNCNVPLQFKASSTLFRTCSRCGTANSRQAKSPVPAQWAPQETNSLLKLGTEGVYDGLKFSLVGYLQYIYNEGYTNFWLGLWEDGDTDWLAEWEGGYAWVERLSIEPNDNLMQIDIGGELPIEGVTYTVIRRSQHLQNGWEGELPSIIVPANKYIVLELEAPGDKTAKIHLYSKGLSEIYHGEFDYFGAFGFTNLRK